MTADRDPSRAQELGIPMSYDHGAMRETWLTHAPTAWTSSSQAR
jgi:hypothetical protein